MVKCQQCGVEVAMPFKCPYCGGYLCYDHRLPENHDCKGLKSEIYAPRLAPRARAPTRTTLTELRVVKPKARNILKMTSRKELEHLAVGLSVFTLIGFTMLIDSIPALLLRPEIMALTVLGMLSSFLVHEIAHKVTAQKMGYWAEFRLSFSGLFLTLISAIFPVKIIAPGAVKVVGLYINEANTGKIALSGPFSNIVQAIVYAAMLKFAAQSHLLILALYVLASLNLSLALFNLIPLGPMDGAKVFRWSKSIWASSIVSALAVWLSLVTII